MSVTFWIPDAPKEIVHEDCDCNLPEEERPDPSCYFCKGTGSYTREESTAPNCNFANGNAYAILGLLELPTEEWGHLSPEEAATVLRRATKAKNLRGLRAPLDREPEAYRGAKGCRVFACGNTDESTQRRLDYIIEVLMYASEHKMSVSWG